MYRLEPWLLQSHRSVNMVCSYKITTYIWNTVENRSPCREYYSSERQAFTFLNPRIATVEFREPSWCAYHAPGSASHSGTLTSLPRLVLMLKSQRSPKEKFLLPYLVSVHHLLQCDITLWSFFTLMFFAGAPWFGLLFSQPTSRRNDWCESSLRKYHTMDWWTTTDPEERKLEWEGGEVNAVVRILSPQHRQGEKREEKK